MGDIAEHYANEQNVFLKNQMLLYDVSGLLSIA